MDFTSDSEPEERTFLQAKKNKISVVFKNYKDKAQKKSIAKPSIKIDQSLEQAIKEEFPIKKIKRIKNLENIDKIQEQIMKKEEKITKAVKKRKRIELIFENRNKIRGKKNTSLEDFKRKRFDAHIRIPLNKIIRK